ncbi:MAG: ion transporter [Parasporobacterium sp.]|nr:ion transporter [Parasporobacterium sp.]
MKQKEPLKKRIFEIIQIGNRNDLPSRLFDYFIVICIALNISVLFMETFDVFSPYYPLLEGIEAATIGIFIVEYLLRLWTAQYLYPGMGNVKAALRFVVSFYGVIDLLTILPFFFLSGFVALRILRIVRIFRLFKVNATYDSFHVISSVFRKKWNQIISSVFIIFLLMLVSSLCMYSAEHEAQPGIFQNGFSGIWWSLSTIFTVGYGDIYPITILGRVMTVLITFLGVGAVAIPTGIISAGFVEEYTQLAQKPHENRSVSTFCETVRSGSPLAGQSVQAIERSQNIRILAVKRENEILIPGDQTMIRRDDTLICQR